MKMGILGGGQLGRMMLQEAANYPVQTYVLENDAACPSAALCHHFVKGDIKDFDTVYAFGKLVDVLTIEIENVNIEALEKLEEEGLTVIPKPAALRTIKNKVIQKEFYANHQLPTADFVITENREAVKQHLHFLPAVHKSATGGYDGKGVQLLPDAAALSMAFDELAVLEKMVPIEKEIAVMVAIGQDGEQKVYPAVEMVFDPKLNLLDYQMCPAAISAKQKEKAEQLALQLVVALNSPGLFAVELFVDKQGNILINETAPRPHNSGHHTIEAHYSSQFDMLLRILMNQPLGNPSIIAPSLMLNLIGEDGYEGPAYYEGLRALLQMGNSYVHLYGKTQTKSGRKMGHVTLMGEDLNQLIEQANRIKEGFKIITR